MTTRRDLWAVVPVKELAFAKRRLERSYSASFRHALARVMLEDVLRALAGAQSIAGIVVVSLDREACAIARRFGARIFDDDARGGHTAAVVAAARRLAREKRDAMLTLPADVPCVTAEEVDALIDAHGDRPAFTIVPSHDRRGSNAIVVSAPDAVPLEFGDDSFVPHVARACSMGIKPAVVALPGIALDIDHPVDLDRFARMGGASLTSAFVSANRRRTSSEAKDACMGTPP